VLGSDEGPAVGKCVGTEDGKYVGTELGSATSGGKSNQSSSPYPPWLT
jgi:hypothetical protein